MKTIDAETKYGTESNSVVQINELTDSTEQNHSILIALILSANPPNKIKRIALHFENLPEKPKRAKQNSSLHVRKRNTTN